ncbi:MAG: hypothetical protein QOJ07_3716 [Thermoleophilaceae bacterium]|jgi:hypothetical protein|nr:hypothetical protein [Thermoleophilaceae bacterium]
MAIAVLMEIPGGTQEMYDRVMEDLQLEGVPEGGIAHLAGPMEGGWRVLDAWESQDAFQRFYDERLGAALSAAGVPIDGPPKFAELYNVMTADGATSPAT